MKIIKYLVLFFLGPVILLLGAFWLLNSLLGDSDEYYKRQALAVSAITEIGVFFDKHGRYPDKLSELQIFTDSEFRTYVTGHAFRYWMQKSDPPHFVFFWLKDQTGWTGYHCTNDKTTLTKSGFTPVNPEPDAMGCYTIDLH